MKSSFPRLMDVFSAKGDDAMQRHVINRLQPDANDEEILSANMSAAFNYSPSLSLHGVRGAQYTPLASFRVSQRIKVMGVFHWSIFDRENAATLLLYSWAVLFSPSLTFPPFVEVYASNWSAYCHGQCTTKTKLPRFCFISRCSALLFRHTFLLTTSVKKAHVCRSTF